MTGVMLSHLQVCILCICTNMSPSSYPERHCVLCSAVNISHHEVCYINVSNINNHTRTVAINGASFLHQVVYTLFHKQLRQCRYNDWCVTNVLSWSQLEPPQSLLSYKQDMHSEIYGQIDIESSRPLAISKKKLKTYLYRIA